MPCCFSATRFLPLASRCKRCWIVAMTKTPKQASLGHIGRGVVCDVVEVTERCNGE
jgi:hypothetical protein